MTVRAEHVRVDAPDTTSGVCSDVAATGPGLLTVRLVGGPTALLRMGGIRLLTDPTFDEPGQHPIGRRTLAKTAGPALSPDEVGAVDAVLLSHDQHPDNLDATGRVVLRSAPQVLTTASAAEHLGGNALALPATEAINGRLEHHRGSALGVPQPHNYIARSLLESGAFTPQLHPGL